MEQPVVTSKLASASLDDHHDPEEDEGNEIPAVPPPPYTPVAEDRTSLHSTSSVSRTTTRPSSELPEDRTSVGSTEPEEILYPVPTVNDLQAQIQSLDRDQPEALLAWAKEAIKHGADSSCHTTDVREEEEPHLPPELVDRALRIIGRQASGSDPVPEALFLRGTLRSIGQFPHFWTMDLRRAFTDFETSARLGWLPGWYRIGQDYEMIQNVDHAKRAYERGSRLGDTGCLYRMGMASLLGQLGVGIDYPAALADLRRAADQAEIDTPEASYVLGMLLAGEHTQVPTEVLDAHITTHVKRRHSTSTVPVREHEA